MRFPSTTGLPGRARILACELGIDAIVTGHYAHRAVGWSHRRGLSDFLARPGGRAGVLPVNGLNRFMSRYELALPGGTKAFQPTVNQGSTLVDQIAGDAPRLDRG